MGNLYESSQENLARTYIADNIRLEKELAEAKAKLEAAEAAIDILKNLLVYYQDGEAKGEKMGRYVNGIKHEVFRPA